MHERGLIIKDDVPLVQVGLYSKTREPPRQRLHVCLDFFETILRGVRGSVKVQVPSEAACRRVCLKTLSF